MSGGGAATPPGGRATELTVLGETMASLSPDHVGPLRHARSLGLSAAGSESNVAIGVSRLGHRVSWVGRVGDDELGRLVLARLRGEDLDVRAVVDPDAPTGLMLKEQPVAGQGRVHYYRTGSAGSRLHPADLPEELLTTTRVLHSSGITLALSPTAREAVFRAVTRVRQAGGTVSFDLNHRARLWSAEEAGRTLREILPLADVVFASDDEARMVTGEETATLEDAARALRDLGPATAVVTRGADGALSATRSGVRPVPAVPVRAVDPVGAGDAFVAGYLSALLAGLDEEERLARAAAVGALCAATEGDWEGLPDRSGLAWAGVDAGTVRR